MAPIVIIDKTTISQHLYAQELEYRQPNDSKSFWTGKYPTAGKVQALMCVECGRINLYGSARDEKA